MSARNFYLISPYERPRPEGSLAAAIYSATEREAAAVIVLAQDEPASLMTAQYGRIVVKIEPGDSFESLLHKKTKGEGALVSWERIPETTVGIDAQASRTDTAQVGRKIAYVKTINGMVTVREATAEERAAFRNNSDDMGKYAHNSLDSRVGAVTESWVSEYRPSPRKRQRGPNQCGAR
jgi:hypothetical protein